MLRNWIQRRALPAPASLPGAISTPLGRRLTTAAVGLPIVLGAVLAGTEFVAALVALAAVLAVGELALAFAVPLRSAAFGAAVAAIGATVGAAASGDIPVLWPVVAGALGVLGAAAAQATLLERGEAPAERLAAYIRSAALGLGALLYLGLLAATFVLLRAQPDGTEWLLLAALATMTTDTGAFAGGRLLGRRPLAPAVSPNKTVEGALIGWAAGFVAVIALNEIFGLPAPIWKAAILGLLLPLLTQLGDLVESLLKRAAGVKDASRLIPGHGGVLDRLDSLLFAVPTVYFFVQWAAI